MIKIYLIKYYEFDFAGDNLTKSVARFSNYIAASDYRKKLVKKINKDCIKEIIRCEKGRDEIKFIIDPDKFNESVYEIRIRILTQKLYDNAKEVD